MITTTLNRIRAHRPCASGWTKLLDGLGKTVADDDPLSFDRILEINGIDDALWCCRAEPQYAREWRLFACWCARQNWHLLTDPRSRAAVEIAERYANGKATGEELAAASAAARVAAWDAASAAARDAAWAAARDAVRAAARDAARDAAWVAAWAAARDAVRAAARDAARDAAWAAARDAAWAAARAAQSVEFLRVITETESSAALSEGGR